MEVRPARSSRQERRLKKVASNRKNCSFDDLAALLKAYSYTPRKRSGSSHVVFTRKGCNPITVPFRRPVKENYVRHVLQAIEQIENGENP
jgi:hypothetical protein